MPSVKVLSDYYEGCLFQISIERPDFRFNNLYDNSCFNYSEFLRIWRHQVKKIKKINKKFFLKIITTDGGNKEQQFRNDLH